MWVVSKEGLIVVGAVLILGIVGLVLLLGSPARSPSERPAPLPAPTPAAQSAAAVPVRPSPPPAVATASTGPTRAIDGVIYAGEYAHNTEAEGFAIHWSNDARTLRVGLISPGTGYVSIGFDPVRRMEGANYILGAVVNGQVIARDDFGTGPVVHTSDVANGGTQDILEAAGSEVGGKTYFEFAIPLDSGDALDKVLVPGQTYNVLIAYHDTDDSFDAWHSRRGSGTMALDPAP